MRSISEEIQQTLELIKAAYADGPVALVPELAKDFDTSLGLRAYNLEPAAKVLFPTMTPIRNKLPRVGGKGNAVMFKAITGINTAGLSGVAQEGTMASQVTTTTDEKTFPYKSFGLSDKVTFEAQWTGRGFIDAKAVAAANLLKATMTAEEKLIIGGLSSPIGNCPDPIVTSASTGGSIGTVTVYVKTTAVTMMGESLPSNVVNTGALTGSTNKVTVTPTAPANKPVLYYNVYACTDGINYRYQGKTNGADFVMTSVGATGAAPPTEDKSGSSLAYNGILAQLFAANSGAYLKALKAVLALSDIDDLFLNLWNNGMADPDTIYANAQEASKITNLVLGGSGTPYHIVVTNQGGVTGNYRVSRLVNKVTGKEVRIEVHPHLVQGLLMALSEQLPAWYTGSNIENVWVMDLVQDYVQIEYAPSGPAWPIEIRGMGCLKGYIPLVNGVLYAITQG